MTDIEIAQKNVMEPITKVASKIGIPEESLELYGNYKAKISFKELQALPASRPLLNGWTIPQQNSQFTKENTTRLNESSWQ